MLIMIARRDKAVVACTDDGETTRFHECRNVQCAVALEAKLNGDIAFAGRVGLRMEPAAVQDEAARS